MSFTDSSTASHRTQRARSLAADSRRHRDALYHRNYHSNEITAVRSPETPSPFSIASSFTSDNRPEVDLYSRPTSPPLPALPPSALDARREAKIQQKQKKEQLVAKLQQQQQALEKVRLDRIERLERQQAKQDRKQKRSDYKQIYQDQHDYQRAMDERKAQKRQQLSLPIYTTSTFSSSSSGHSSTTLSEVWSPQSPSKEIYYHSSRYYHRDPSQNTSAFYQHQHHDSLSSTNSGNSSRVLHILDDKARAHSLKNQSTKSMYDLRPWSGAPQSPAYDYRSGYESDETAMSHGWDSLMDTLHSPTMTSSTMTSPMNSPGADSSFKDETDFDQMETSLGSLSLSQEDRTNGHGKYLLVLGANGRTGIELVKQGLERNYRVTAFVRDDRVLLEDSTLRKNQNLLIVRGSPTCQADLDRVVEGQDVVVNVIGARLMASDTTISSHSQVVLNNAMKKHGVKRLIVVTSYGCLGLRNYLISTKKLFSKMFMTGILKDKVLQEEIIQRDTSVLDWTIVRPITLKDGDLSQKYWLSSDELPSTSKVKVLTRPDLAHYLLSIINAPEEHRAIRSIAGKPKSAMAKQKSYCNLGKREVVENTRLSREQADSKEQSLEKRQPLPNMLPLQAPHQPHMKVHS